MKEIFEELKTFLSPRSIWQKVFVPLLQLYNSFRTPSIEQAKIQKSLTVFLMILNNTETILN